MVMVVVVVVVVLPLLPQQYFRGTESYGVTVNRRCAQACMAKSFGQQVML